MIAVRVMGVGVLGPGLDGWEFSAPILRGEKPYAAAEVELAPPTFLNSRERRRTGLTVRLALNVAEEAVRQSGILANELASVFGTANGDGQVVHKLLESVVKTNEMVSPTQFHNSVHNAAVGYWAIGAGSHKPSTCIAAHDFTFAAALVKSMTHVACEQQPVLMAVYDAPYPEPLNAARPMAQNPFGLALVLAPPEYDSGLAELVLTGARCRVDNISSGVTRPREAAMHDIWSGNPAARAIPVLEALASGEPAAIVLEYPQDGELLLELTPC